jgi:hypothetical protein
MENVDREALVLHDKLGLLDDDSFSIIHSALERIAGSPDYENYN